MDCQNCHLRVKLPNQARMIFSKGFRDFKGCDHFFLYCRECFHISDFIGGGCLSLLMGRFYDCVGVIDPVRTHASMTDAFLVMMPEEIIYALREDGVIPWPGEDTPRAEPRL